MFLVGEFSRLTHLTAKTLRHYHDVDLLVPAVIDAATGYRYYTPGQVPQAQLIRRLRDVRMPVPQIREVLAAPEGSERNAVIGLHLERLQQELIETATAVGSLRSMLADDGAGLSVSYRPGESESVLSFTDEVSQEEIARWCQGVFPRLFVAARQWETWPSGAGGALYSGAWFSGQGRSVTALLPVDSADRAQGAGLGDVRTQVLDAQPYAIAVHHGPYADIDRTYGALGEHVHDLGIAAEGPIRENYLISPADTQDPSALRTEVCWPITHVPG
nr:MerR family transcriptional regulator [Kineosporia babensis]